MFYTIVPLEYIFEGEEESEESESKKQKNDDIEIKREGVSLMVQSSDAGHYKITRLISTNPNDYLKPEWQPGVEIV
ncbi:MAG TPA: hypothetical protein DDW50_14405 [Firmicutes bacterium]|jgi:hypothetical protein|nr:hypothetical protein [Bacillota bacterium]